MQHVSTYSSHLQAKLRTVIALQGGCVHLGSNMAYSVLYTQCDLYLLTASLSNSSSNLHTCCVPSVQSYFNTLSHVQAANQSIIFHASQYQFPLLLYRVEGRQSPPAKRVSYRGTEAQPNPPSQQRNRQPPHKTKNEAQPPQKQKAITYRSTSRQKYLPPPPTESSKSRRTADTSSFAHTTHLTLLTITQ